MQEPQLVVAAAELLKGVAAAELLKDAAEGLLRDAVPLKDLTLRGKSDSYFAALGELQTQSKQSKLCEAPVVALLVARSLKAPS